MAEKRYKRKGQCNRCGWCCKHEDCEHFIMKGKIAVCLIHSDPNRPLKCVLYPDAPPLMTDTCGYYFEDVWDNNKIVRRGLR